MATETKKGLGSAPWKQNPKVIERARIVSVVSLSKRHPGELVRIIMDWLDDEDLETFCRRNLDDSDLAFIEEAGRLR